MNPTIKKILICGPIFNTLSGPSGQGGKLFEKLKEEGFEIYKRSYYRNKLVRFADSLWFVVIKTNKYDIILLQSFGLLAFIMEDLVSWVANKLNKPIIFTLRGGAFLEFYQKYPSWVKKVLKRATIINTPSLFLKENLNNFGFKVEYIPNFIEQKKFPFERNVENPHSILWVRAFHDIYHPELAIETVHLLKQKFPKVKLTMIGPDQGTLSECQKLISKLKLNDVISIKGIVSNIELYKYYQTHQVYITTTRYESFGVAILEAASCGISQVSTKVGEIPYIWGQENCILFAKRSAADFSKKIENLFLDEELRNNISLNAANKAKNYTWDKIGPQWIELLNNI